ncbi:sigma-70 family RNA polymerase sigma factor [Mucilaginibacter sp.]|uniref:RNA polymerase sigma factor n=1 Tax=Mucilaginibacter sp. TaxID=1882438 RepID=UPI00260D975E|nr:sigma-70 family RNA polymerase sigma factor [Mucilaginibacter sp.]MDB4922944.1 sigE 2 [Mucilaginibacter sp.]
MEKAELLISIKECLRNNKIHQKKVYVAYYGFAYCIALRYANSREEASIIMNKGFYNAFVRLGDYDKTIEFKEWLKFLILHAAIEYLFKVKQYPEIPRESEISDHNPRHNNLETGFSYDYYIKILHQLPFRNRAVFNLFAIEGYEHEKIANMLNISINSSKLLLTQARENLNFWILQSR